MTKKTVLTGRFSRNSIFRNKEGGDRVQGVITKVGADHFERARRQLARLAGRPYASDGDVVEFLSRGEDNTRAYLAGTAK